jgi:hypothetical protein
MKSYIETTNERAREANARSDAGLDICMTHTNINTGGLMTEKKDDTESVKRTVMSSLQADDEASAAVQKTPNRVTLDSMKDKIKGEEYIHPDSIPHMTICVIMLENGFALVGKSTPADAENFNEELGEKFAFEDALRQMWPLEAYLLRERMML